MFISQSVTARYVHWNCKLVFVCQLQVHRKNAKVTSLISRRSQAYIRFSFSGNAYSIKNICYKKLKLELCLQRVNILLDRIQEHVTDVFTTIAA